MYDLEKRRASARKYYYTHKEKCTSYAKDNKEKVYKNIRKWDQVNYHKRLSYIILHHALNEGYHGIKIIKPLNCDSCNVKGRLDGHHDDYSKPLEVKWLCRSCHKELHRIKVPVDKTENSQS